MKLLKYIGLTFITMSACASTPMVPLLENRTLELCPTDEPGYDFCYKYEVCVKKFIFCTKKEWREEKFDLDNPEDRRKFRNFKFKFKAMP